MKILNPNAPQYASTSMQLRDKIQNLLNNNIGAPNNVANNLRNLTEIRVENSLGLHRFEIVDDVVFVIN